MYLYTYSLLFDGSSFVIYDRVLQFVGVTYACLSTKKEIKYEFYLVTMSFIYYVWISGSKRYMGNVKLHLSLTLVMFSHCRRENFTKGVDTFVLY